MLDKENTFVKILLSVHIMKSKKYIRDRFKKITKYLLLFRETKQPENLHQYRVEIKKINAFHLFLEYCDKDFKGTKKFKQCHSLFHQSGKIRDFVVMHNLMKKYNIDFIAPTSVSDTKKHLKKIRKFCDDIPSYLNTLKNTEEELLKKRSFIHKKELHHYLKKRKKKIGELLHSSSGKHLHDARKAGKDILYLSKLDKGYKAETIQYFDKLQTAIGNWHDKQVLITTLDEIHNPRNNDILKKLKLERKIDLQTIQKLKQSGQ